MASVQSTRAGKYAHRGLLEDEPPDHVESAGELLIKQLVQKQTNTNITLKQQLQEEKQFERGVGFVSLNELGMGSCSLREFEEKRQQVERVKELEKRGLARGEAQSMLTNGQLSKTTPVQAISQKCIDHSHSTSHHDTIKRQEWELAMSVKPNSLETRLYQFVLKSGSNRAPIDTRPLDHPVHQLAAMEQRLLQTADPQSLARTYRRKRRQQLAADDAPQGAHYKAPDRHQSLWDAIESPVIVEKKPYQPQKTATCKNQTLYTIRGGKIVQLDVKDNDVCTDPPVDHKFRPSGQAFVALQSPTESPQVSGRLTESEIKQLPRFQNYERGTVSKTLYIKNLSNSVTEVDLAAVFHQFQETNGGNIIFRLMTGKMRGQAFITFSSCEKATESLQAVNGTILKGKPMVIQYGKQQD